MDRKRRLLYIGEPPTVNSGFGTVSKYLVPALAKEFELNILATGGYGKDCMEGLSDYGCINAFAAPPEDAHSTKVVDVFCRQKDIEIIFTYYDIGSIYKYYEESTIGAYPNASYCVTEGAPLMQSWKRLFGDFIFRAENTAIDCTIDAPLLASKYASDRVKDETGAECPFAYHGVDHANWQQYPKDVRKELRAKLAQELGDPSFNDCFLLMYVARNADRKMWPRLFEAIKVAREMAPEFDFRLYGHTKRFNNFKDEGYILDALVSQIGLPDNTVMFPQAHVDIGGFPFESPVDSDAPSMVKFYNMCDLYVHPSGVEGCGLPILEAAKCGVPVLTTKYAAGWEYAEPFAMPIEVQTYWYHRSGMKQALIDVEDCARKIVMMAKNPALRIQHGNMGMKRCNYQWSQLADAAVDAAHRAYASRRS